MKKMTTFLIPAKTPCTTVKNSMAFGPQKAFFGWTFSYCKFGQTHSPATPHRFDSSHSSQQREHRKKTTKTLSTIEQCADWLLTWFRASFLVLRRHVATTISPSHQVAATVRGTEAMLEMARVWRDNPRRPQSSLTKRSVAPEWTRKRRRNAIVVCCEIQYILHGTPAHSSLKVELCSKIWCIMTAYQRWHLGKPDKGSIILADIM